MTSNQQGVRAAHISATPGRSHSVRGLEMACFANCLAQPCTESEQTMNDGSKGFRVHSFDFCEGQASKLSISMLKVRFSAKKHLQNRFSSKVLNISKCPLTEICIETCLFESKWQQHARFECTVAHGGILKEAKPKVARIGCSLGPFDCRT